MFNFMDATSRLADHLGVSQEQLIKAIATVDKLDNGFRIEVTWDGGTSYKSYVVVNGISEI